MLFWAIAILLTAVTCAWILRGLFGVSEDTEAVSRFDLQVYRDQLSEVERDLERGRLSAEDAERTRLEISRRILEADKAVGEGTQTQSADRAPTKLAAVILIAVLFGGTAAVYFNIGAPGVSDLPLQDRLAALQEARSNRPSQLEAEEALGAFPAQPATDEYLDLVAKLREAVAQRPDDLTGLRLLARHEAALGNFSAARTAQQQVVLVQGESSSAEDLTDLAELMIIAANEYVSPEAEQALGLALQRDPRNPRARYYSGLDLAQNGRPDLTYRIWSNLLAEGPEDAPWIGPIREQIESVARMAGMSPSLPGPSADDVEAASGMSEEDRQTMIRGMVDQLSERLATEGGTPDEWARLIRALGVLGETAQASAIWNEAKETFKDAPDALALLREAARDAEVSN